MGNSASTSSLSPAGSSTYSSDILHVGDGTWDSSRDDFLLPNIQGLNLATMQYNGMGNRFRALSGYRGIIIGHGVVAAVTFLGVVPAAIFIARFYQRPRRALRLHIILQILTVILTAVIFTLGFIAVGPERSFTNPHHGIGTAIFALVLVQALAGAFVHRTEKGKSRTHLPIRLMLHQWVGRALALLGIAQIPIGLTLYGTPLWTFIVYAVVVLFLIILYFVLTYRSYQPLANGYMEGSYVSGTQTERTESSRHEKSKSNRFGTWAAGLTGGAGLAALRRRRSTGSRDQRSTMLSSRSSDNGTDSRVQEKYSDDDQDEGRFASMKNKLTAWRAAGGAGIAGLRSSDTRKLRKRNNSNDDRNRRQYDKGRESDVSSIHALEEGRRTTRTDSWQNVEDREAAQQAEMERAQGRESESRSQLQSRRSTSSSSTESRRSGRGGGKLAGFRAAGGIGAYFKRRRDRKEQRRVEAERQREKENRRMWGSQRGSAPSNNSRGDGSVQNQNPTQPYVVYDPASPVRQSVYPPLAPQMSQQSPIRNGPPPPRVVNSNEPDYGTAPPPPVHSSPLTGPPTNLQRPPVLYEAIPASASQVPTYPTAVPIIYPENRTGPSSTSSRPPVAVKVKVHNDGAHVTLRRLGEEEAAKERLARRQARSSPRRRPVSSVSNVSDGNRQRSRRSSASPARYVPSNGRAPLQSSMRTNTYQSYNPPITSPVSGMMGSSPQTGTDISNFDTNRQRRRAERQRPESSAAGALAAGRPESKPRVSFT